MRRSCTAVGLAVAIILLSVVPASAETWIQLRYWSTNVQFQGFGNTVNYLSNLGGLTIRRTFMDGAWAASAQFDTGTNNGNQPASETYNRWWSFNLHRNFATPRGTFSIYGGWGGADWEAAGVGQFFYLRGPRLGVDAKISLHRGWYFTGDFAYGPFGTANAPGYLSGGPAMIDARMTDSRVGIGHMRDRWGLEGGYRWAQWTYTPGPGSCPATPCQDRWHGWYIGVNVTTP